MNQNGMFRKTILPLLIVLMIGGLNSCKKSTPSIEYMSGVVKDVDGNPIAEVEVKSNDYTVRTDEHGMFTLEHIQNTGGRYVMDFHKKGYFPVVRSGESSSVGLVEVVLVKEEVKDVSVKSKFSAAKGSKVSVGGMTVDFPKNGVVYEDGTPCKGDVNVNVLYLDPKKSTFQAAMPGGDLVAQRAGEEAPLVSYGMVNVVMKDAKGKKLQVNEEVKSKVTFPIPEGMANNAPDQMPLWHFNESKGVWEESGIAVRNGDVYEGEVAHFSWVNLDDPKQFVVLKGKVKDDKGNALSGVKVIVEQVYAYSDENGEYSVRIPSETDVNVTVRKEDYLNYDNEFSVLVKGQPGNSTFTQDIVLPSFPSVTGKLENMCDDNVLFPVFCRYERDGKVESTPFTLPEKKGNFSVKVPTDAQNVVVHVVVPGGDEVTHEVSFTGEDSQIYDPIMVCRQSLADRDKPHITMGEDVVVLEGDELDYSNFEGHKLTMSGSGVSITVPNYKEGVIDQDGQVICKKQGFESTSARIEKRKVDNHVSIHVVASGKATTESGEKKDAVLEGTYTIQYLYKGPCDDFSKLCWDSKIPNMRTPIKYVKQRFLLELPTSIFFYDTPRESDYKAIISVTESDDPFYMFVGYANADTSSRGNFISAMEAAGYVRSEERTEGNTEYVSYSKEDFNVEIAYVDKSTNSFLVLENDSDAPRAQMVIHVSTGFKKWLKNLIKKYLGIDWLS